MRFLSRLLVVSEPLHQSLSGERPVARARHATSPRMLAAHPTYDDFWRERCAWEVLDRIKVPLYSSGVWGKMKLHTRGNIDGYPRASGPKKLRMSGRAERMGGGGGILQRRIPPEACCCRSTIIISRARTPTIWRGRMSNTRCAARTRCAAPSSWPPAGRALQALVSQRRDVRQRHVAERRRPVAADRRRRGRDQLRLSATRAGWPAWSASARADRPAASIRCAAC